MGLHFFAPAAGKQSDPGARSVEPVLLRVLFAGNVRPRQISQRMPNVLGVDLVFTVKGLFKREDAKHLLDPFLYAFDAILAPGPELRGHKVNNRNAARVHLAGYAKVEGR